MKYVIFELVQPEQIKDITTKQYGHIQIVYREVLEELDFPNVESKHSNIEFAMAEIEKNKTKLKNTKLTILPIIEIDYNGEYR